MHPGRGPRPGLGPDAGGTSRSAPWRSRCRSCSRFRSGVVLGHRGKGELLAVAVGNAGRAIPELALIAFMVAFVGVGLVNLTIALMVLGIPPILTNAFVGVRQVDRGAVEAARGMGMTRRSRCVRKVELPLAAPTIMTGVRTAAINIVATATIGPLVGRADARRLHPQPQRLRRRGRAGGGDPGRPAGARRRAGARRASSGSLTPRGASRCSERGRGRIGFPRPRGPGNVLQSGERNPR